MLTAATAALVADDALAQAQHAHPPGMSMPMPSKSVARKATLQKQSTKEAATKKGSAKKITTRKDSVAQPKVKRAVPMDHSQMDNGALPTGTPPEAAAPARADQSHTQHGQMNGSRMNPGATASGPAAAAMDASTMDHSTMNHSQVDHAVMSAGDHAEHQSMTGALNSYPMQRDASGTAWQPDASKHSGIMNGAGDWTLMAHGVVNLVYDHQSGRRGANRVFAGGMLMGMARRPVGNGTLQLKAMLSPDPLMGKRGYPLLLASGETANGTDRLIDRQHPHDFFMELSGSISQNIGGNSSVFLYAGLPGEPAFGPPAFMHREAIMDSPEAPISHHWLDSTHISFGVLTGGLTLGNAKVEVSRFNGREPDEHRWDIETAALDSTAVRVSFNPTNQLSLQGSWGHLENPEQLEPGVDQKRWSASVLYARGIAPGWKLAATFAWGRKTIDHHGEARRDDAYMAEASLKHRDWTIFGRGEITENRELLEDEEHGQAFRVGKVSVGAVRDFRLAEHFSFGAGGLVSLNYLPDDLAPLYGNQKPIAAMGFVRLKLD
ncbi:hypothetical protein OMW55_02220 [Sphingomonas sp. BN140010]|uniref:TonB-dependent receptor n=1 Tax=Sphingomonas arvum TaxID=2992113 RepID=A0ABT3JC30_9SPHN|nr:hypothetical protein [Sphingomonas sp. BN140010]MCW3796626.1 hypothetical protein [Sphingomonas sp. BN140010]